MNPLWLSHRIDHWMSIKSLDVGRDQPALAGRVHGCQSAAMEQILAHVLVDLSKEEYWYLLVRSS